jgi:hypothetical protein
MRTTTPSFASSRLSFFSKRASNGISNNRRRFHFLRILLCLFLAAAYLAAFAGISKAKGEMARPVKPISAMVACTAPTTEQARTYQQAAAAVRTVLEKFNAAKSDAEAIDNALKKVTFDDAMVGKFETVADILEAGIASRNGRFGPLGQATTELNTKLGELNTAFAPYEACREDSSASAEVKATIEDIKSIKNNAQDQLKVSEKLQEMLKGIPDKVNEFITLVAGKAAAAVPLAPQLAPQTLRTELARALPDLARALRIRRQFAPIANRISKALDPAQVTEIKSFIQQKPKFLFDKVDAELQPALTKIHGWGQQAAAVARDQQAAAQDELASAMRDPFHRSSNALALSTVAEAQRRDFTALSDAFLLLLTEMQREDVPDTVLPPNFIPRQAKELSDFTEQLQLMAARFARSVAQLSGDIPVDKSTWTMASVDLFYFDNVERLMKVLSPNTRKVGDNQSLLNDAQTKRQQLDEASQNLEAAERAVEDARQAVGDLQERVRQATVRSTSATQAKRAEISGRRREADLADARARSLTSKRMRADSAKAVAQRRLDQAQAAADAKPNDEKLQAELAIAKSNFDRANDAAEAVKTEEDIATADAQAKHDAIDDPTNVDEELTDLSTELTNAKGALSTAISTRTTATAAHGSAVRAAFLAAQLENFAFAQARDNAPFFTNQAEPRPAQSNTTTSGAPAPGPFLDTDPVSRVMLFAFPDSRTIFIRGQRDDIDLVRQIIQEFDQPHGQAVMTLRTMEISSDGTRDSAKRALRFLEVMDTKLVQAQSNIEIALASVRNGINQQVDTAAKRKEIILGSQIVFLKRQMAALSPQENAAKKGIEDRLRWLELQVNQRPLNEMVAFYDPEVLRGLGLDEKFLEQTVDTNFLNAVIPRPTETVNLAQSLIVLSLASKENRKAIVNGLDARHFGSLRRFLGSDGLDAEILGFQAKLVEALRFNGITHVLELAAAKTRFLAELRLKLEPFDTKSKEIGRKLDALDSEIRDLENELDSIKSRLKDPSLPRQERERLQARVEEINKLVLADVKDKVPLTREKFDNDTKLFAIENDIQKLVRDRDAILSWLQGNASGISPSLLLDRIEKAIATTDDTSELLLQAVGLRRSARFRFTQANESAVNLTFRRYVEQVNRDLTEAFVKPTFRDLNMTLLNEHLGVGVIQETSILASNRLVARVDPRGSAQLAVGQEKNLLEAAIQLTNLFGLAGKGLVSGAGGNPLALAGSGGASSVLSGAKTVLGALDELPREARPAVYGIATGNLFEVTPVIDPSGQALRFKFDLVSATQIREPNDTIDPMLPRIERHSVNTEVQLGDQEIRLISQFQANSRLGVAKRKSGGVPILKDIPGVSEVPLIGWFVKRGGRAAQTQQSFIFCQTNMYPTLSEVIDSSVRSPSFTGLN